MIRRRQLRKTHKKHRKSLRRTRRYRSKVKTGGMAPPISDAAIYSYPPYFPNRGVEGKDVWPVKFTGPNIKDIDVPYDKQFPLGEDIITGVKEQAGGYIYDPKLLKKVQSKRRQHKYLKKVIH